MSGLLQVARCLRWLSACVKSVVSGFALVLVLVLETSKKSEDEDEDEDEEEWRGDETDDAHSFPGALNFFRGSVVRKVSR